MPQTGVYSYKCTVLTKPGQVVKPAGVDQQRVAARRPCIKPGAGYEGIMAGKITDDGLPEELSMHTDLTLGIETVVW